MKTLILAGGYGSRLGNMTGVIPKPLVLIGGKPILWHILKIYSYYGFDDFLILLGYQGEKIKEYFYNYRFINNDFTIDLNSNSITFAGNKSIEKWQVTLIDTGIDNLKGSRIKQAECYLNENINMLTYGDGVSDIDLNALLKFHQSHGKILTLTGVRPPSRFGELEVRDSRVLSFGEKPQVSKGMINGGFMVFSKDLLSSLTIDKNCDFEFGALEDLAKQGQVMVYEHQGFWECVDTERDLNHLNKLWEEKKASWKLW